MVKVRRRWSERLGLGPAPRWRGTNPALLGLAVSLVASIAFVALEAFLTRKKPHPGLLLDWLPLVAAAVALAATVLWDGRRREAAVTAFIGFLGLFPVIHPAPAMWMYAGPVLAGVAGLGLRLEPATRLVAALPALAGLLTAMGAMLGDSASTVVGLLLVAAYMFGLWFLAPYESGWRRPPYLVHMTAAIAIPLAFAIVILVSLFTTGISFPKSWNGLSGGPGFGTIAALLFVVAYPVAMWRLWRSERAQRFLLPSLALPERSPRAPSAEGS